MEWKSKIEDECCEDELEEMITNYVKADFWPNDKPGEFLKVRVCWVPYSMGWNCWNKNCNKRL